ncbi:MAG: 50S ribosomal protein L17 [Planctomycetes bacterium]|nr:50S ribosomal protein L17 [Planctomycetota bacterium]MCC6407828.1 50S ribosomal protein L17 [Planctomycetota bacterium]
MRHRSSVNHLGRTAAHRTAMERNLANALIAHERIITTVPKAKNVKPFIERMVTLSKEPTVHNRRLAFARLRDKDAVSKLFAVLGPRFKARPGGYCRILKLAKPRLGDNGARAILEFVERTPKETEAPTPEVAAEPEAAPEPKKKAKKAATAKS